LRQEFTYKQKGTVTVFAALNMHGDDPKPFTWHATATEIIEKVRGDRAALTQVNVATKHWVPEGYGR